MPIELFDTHSHLDLSDFDHDREEVIERALEAGVSRIIVVGAVSGFRSAHAAIKLAEQYDCIWATVGVHPHDAETKEDLPLLRELSQHERVLAIGETGLDFFRDWSPRELQEKWFRAQIELALEVGLPLIIHSRNAGEECLSILKELGAEKVGGVFHCYSEDADFATRLTEINFIVSIPGTVTFKKAEQVRECVEKIPLTQLMLETDAPYMAPSPYRGKRCESSFVVKTAEMVAQVKNIRLDEVAKQTTETALKFFNIKN